MAIPASVQVIRKWAFAECSKLQSVVFEKNSALEVLESRCFQGVGIEEITIPASAKTFGEGVFRRSNVRNITFEEGS